MKWTRKKSDRDFRIILGGGFPSKEEGYVVAHQTTHFVPSVRSRASGFRVHLRARAPRRA